MPGAMDSVVYKVYYTGTEGPGKMHPQTPCGADEGPTFLIHPQSQV